MVSDTNGFSVIYKCMENKMAIFLKRPRSSSRNWQLSIYTLTTVLLLRVHSASDCYYIAVCPFSASWRIVVEGQVAGSVFPQTKHTDAASLRSSEN